MSTIVARRVFSFILGLGVCLGSVGFSATLVTWGPGHGGPDEPVVWTGTWLLPLLAFAVLLGLAARGYAVREGRETRVAFYVATSLVAASLALASVFTLCA